jgi:biotin carboxyl carrier protein
VRLLEKVRGNASGFLRARARRAPIAGIFYRIGSGEKRLVVEGDAVEVGQALCVIEADGVQLGSTFKTVNQ